MRCAAVPETEAETVAMAVAVAVTLPHTHLAHPEVDPIDLRGGCRLQEAAWIAHEHLHAPLVARAALGHHHLREAVKGKLRRLADPGHPTAAPSCRTRAAGSAIDDTDGRPIA